MQDAVIEQELAGADQALQQLRDLSQALEARLKLRHHLAQDTILHADSSAAQHAAAENELAADSYSKTAPAQLGDTSTTQSVYDETSCSSGTEEDGSQLLPYAAVPGALAEQLDQEEPLLREEQLSCRSAGDSAGLGPCSRFTLGSCCDSTVDASRSASGSELGSSAPAGPALAPAKQVPAWKQYVQQEQQMLRARQKQAATEARNLKQLAQKEAVSWQAKQQQLPFQVQHSDVSGGVRHKLQKTLSMILKDAADRQQAEESASVCSQTARAIGQQPAAAAQVGSKEPGSTAVALPGQGFTTADVVAAAATTSCSSRVDMLPIHPFQSSKGTAGCNSSSTNNAAGASAAGHQSLKDHGSAGRLTLRERANRRSSPGRPALFSSSSNRKHQAWAAADAQTDAEVNSFLLDHWQQHHMATAALVLQCAWRSRVARLTCGRYLSKRHASVHATLQPAFQRWCSWTKAAAHKRCYQQRGALLAWRELLQLQTQLCLKVLHGLKGGALGGDMPPVMMWRMCISTSEQGTKIRPSLGGMLAAILLHRVQRTRQKECFKAWRQLTSLQALQRLNAHRMLMAVLRKVELQRLRQAVRFWRLYAACCICERLQLQLPTFPHTCDVFYAWLWGHERRLYMQQQAVGLSGRLALMRCFVRWHSRVHKMCVMRIAWSGVLLHSRYELLRGGMSAFKANWREEQLHRRMVTAAFLAWQELMDRNKAVAAVRSRIIHVAEARRKIAGLAAFKRFCKMSQLLSAAAVLKQWQARPLALAHIHAWLHDTLHATFYLCWWRWRRRAVAQLRWRASLGLHMYRAHWLSLELVFSGWRKVAAGAKQDPAADLADTGLSAQQDPLQLLDGTSTSEALPADGALDGRCDSADEAEGCPTDEEALVHVTLADYPVGHPWRPLLQRATVLAPQGLRRATGLRLGRAVKDLRELEGSFIVKDSDGGAGGLLCSRLFARAAVSPGLNAMATALLAMNLLWRKAFPADKFWWQRVVGLLKQRAPHPDSWQSLISRPHSRCSSGSSSNSHGAGAVPLEDLQDFLSSQHSSAGYKCSCTRCPHYMDPQATVVIEVVAKPTVDAAALMARARLRLRATGALGVKLDPLQVPDVSIASSSATASPTAATPSAPRSTNSGSNGSSSASATCSNQASTGVAASNSRDGGAAVDSSCGSGNSSASSVWPACWSCEDVAALCRLAQAEELLETVVHLLLGVGADSSTELYEKLQQMTRGSQRAMQGDLLAWLLSAALAQDSAHACTVLARARARDELLIATMEMRERAMALHLHIPHKFTLNTKRMRVDVRATWTGIISRVEQERNWETSSTDEDTDDPQELLWASLQAQLPQQQLQWLPKPPANVIAPFSASGRLARSAHAATQAPQATGPVLPQLPGAAQSAQQSSMAGAQQVGQGRLSTGPDGAQAAVMALAAAAAGPMAKLSAAQEHLAPGMMLAQAPLPSGEVWSSEHVNSSHATGSVPANQPHSLLQQQLEAEQQVTLQQQQKLQEEAKQKRQKQQRQAKASAQGLFGSKPPVAAAGSKAAGSKAVGRSCATAGAQPAAYIEGHEAEIFTGPDFLPIASLSRLRSGPASDRSKANTSRSSAAGEQATAVGFDTVETPSAAATAGTAVIVGSSAAEQPSYSSTPAAGAAQSIVSVKDAAKAAVADMAAAAVAVTEGTDDLLKSELENIITDLLAPLLPQAIVNGSGPARPAPAEDGPGAGSVTDSAGPQSAGPGGDASCSTLQGVRSAAQCLAGACVEWVLQPAFQQQQQQLLLSSGVLVKPFTAPGGVHSELLSRPGSGSSESMLNSSSSSSNTSGTDMASKAAEVQHSISRRPASAAAILQSARAAFAPPSATALDAAALAEQPEASPIAAASSDIFQQHQQNQAAEALYTGRIEAAGSFRLDNYGQGASWLPLAAQLGLLDPEHAQIGCELEAQCTQQQQQQQQYSQASQQQQDDPDNEYQDLIRNLQEEQSCGQGQISSCSSLPSIPSVQGFWTQQTGRAGCDAAAATGTGPKCAVAGSHLPPIAAPAVARLFRGSAPGELSSKQQPVHHSHRRQQQQGGIMRLQEQETQELLPQVAAALPALQMPHQQPGSTQQQLLDSMHRALSLLEPAQLQQQVQLLLQAQQQNGAVLFQQQQQQHEEAVRILPWGGELQPARPPGINLSPAGASGVSGAAAVFNAVLSNLLTASLSTRVAFWRQVAIQKPQHGDMPMQQQQQLQLQGFANMSSSSPVSDQLHQLAWSSILISGSTKRQRQQEQQLLQQRQQQHKLQQSGIAAGPMAELKQRLHTYLEAHMQWRRRQQHAPTLQPAEKWVTLEHEEQVLEFITSMTLAVHQQLLRKHLGLPPAGQRRSSAAFGSSASRDPAATAASQANMAPEAANIKAVGSGVDKTDARRIAPTAPRRVPARVVPVYIVPRPDEHGVPRHRAMCTSRQSRLVQDRLDLLQGWETTDEYGEMHPGLPSLMPAGASSQRGPGPHWGALHRGPAALHGAGRVSGMMEGAQGLGSPGSLRGVIGSFPSSESSWAA